MKPPCLHLKQTNKVTIAEAEEGECNFWGSWKFTEAIVPGT